MMIKYYKWLLFIPILFITLGTYILISNEFIIRKQHLPNNLASNTNQGSAFNNLNESSKRSTNYAEELKSNRESAFPFFVLGAGLLLFILVMPKLSELSFSPTAGFALKLLQEVQESISEVQLAASTIEAKVNQQTIQTILAEPNLTVNTITFKDEVNRLENTRKKLELYSGLFQNTLLKK